jgi:hypothetical protein
MLTIMLHRQDTSAQKRLSAASICAAVVAVAMLTAAVAAVAMLAAAMQPAYCTGNPRQLVIKYVV